MKKRILLTLLYLLPLLLSAAPKHKVILQVLGSGGPEMNDKRASASYLIWIDGKSRILIDCGGGSALRFEEAEANIADLKVVLLTHLHIDHTADLPALLKAGFFTDRNKTLPIYGPFGNRVMPDTESFIHRLFASGKGAWEYMGDHLDGRADFQIKPYSVSESMEIITLFNENNISVDAITVHHGNFPAIAYRINIADKSITLSGDMNGDYHTLELLAKDTDILVMHNAVPQNATGMAASLHMTPHIIGEIAQKANPKTVILSHRMRRTGDKELETISEIRKSYKGKVKFADDLSTFLVL
jgi:ribonuclease BN (tRNA processing enzyme)